MILDQEKWCSITVVFIFLFRLSPVCRSSEMHSGICGAHKSGQTCAYMFLGKMGGVNHIRVFWPFPARSGLLNWKSSLAATDDVSQNHTKTRIEKEPETPRGADDNWPHVCWHPDPTSGLCLIGHCLSNSVWRKVCTCWSAHEKLCHVELKWTAARAERCSLLPRGAKRAGSWWVKSPFFWCDF